MRRTRGVKPISRRLPVIFPAHPRTHGRDHTPLPTRVTVPERTDAGLRAGGPGQGKARSHTQRSRDKVGPFRETAVCRRHLRGSDVAVDGRENPPDLGTAFLQLWRVPFSSAYFGTEFHALAQVSRKIAMFFVLGALVHELAVRSPKARMVILIRKRRCPMYLARSGDRAGSGASPVPCSPTSRTSGCTIWGSSWEFCS